jgi:hypothetical protein
MELCPDHQQKIVDVDLDELAAALWRIQPAWTMTGLTPHLKGLGRTTSGLVGHAIAQHCIVVASQHGWSA